MKKSILIVLAVATATLFSCKKTTEKIATEPLPEKTIISNWINMNFVTGSTANPDGLKATHFFDPGNIYDVQKHTRMAFVKLADGYRALPTTIGGWDLSFEISFVSFDVMANAAHQFGSNEADLNSCQFRYMVIPNSVVLANDIDWTDYEAVAAALNIEK